jgi:tetrapyrrole methylase family protein/MazG family protein
VLDALLAEARLRWGLDPGDGIQVVPAERLIGLPIDPTMPVLIVGSTTLRADPKIARPAHPIPGRHGRASPGRLDLLRRLYPGDHPVGRLGAIEPTTIAALTEADLDGPLYLRALDPIEGFGSPWAMPAISARLRQPDGCPWDREQTHRTLRSHLLEEAYEVYDVLDADVADPALADELGDLWLQIVLHAQLAAEAGVFDLADVQAAIARKIVRRHPHVFGEAEARTASDVNRQWERIKAAERDDAADGDAAERRSALAGISASLPALAASQEIQERAANLGYDWPSTAGVLDKVAEEAAELAAATEAAERSEELGDLLFVVVNLARRTGVNAEAALRAANTKFRTRFSVVERLAAERRVALRDLSFEELDALWDRAKEETAR